MKLLGGRHGSIWVSAKNFYLQEVFGKSKPPAMQVCSSALLVQKTAPKCAAKSTAPTASRSPIATPVVLSLAKLQQLMLQMLNNQNKVTAAESDELSDIKES